MPSSLQNVNCIEDDVISRETEENIKRIKNDNKYKNIVQYHSSRLSELITEKNN